MASNCIILRLQPRKIFNGLKLDSQDAIGTLRHSVAILDSRYSTISFSRPYTNHSKNSDHCPLNHYLRPYTFPIRSRCLHSTVSQPGDVLLLPTASRRYSTDHSRWRASNRQTVTYIAAIAITVVGLSYAAVPLYRLYCQVRFISRRTTFSS